MDRTERIGQEHAGKTVSNDITRFLSGMTGDPDAGEIRKSAFAATSSEEGLLC